jgi:hypothetical protein
VVGAIDSFIVILKSSDIIQRLGEVPIRGISSKASDNWRITDMAVDIFISVGRPLTKQQEEFVSVLEEFLRANGMNPRALGRNEFAHKNPLKFVEEVMRQCAATIVIAFERVHVTEGVERRGSADERPVTNQNITTAWNQIEAAMAYTMGHSLFVLVEHGCRTDGLLESGYDWYVQHIEMTRDALTTKAFVGSFMNWKSEVSSRQEARASEQVTRATRDVDKMTLGQIVSSLRLSHLLTLVALVIAYTGLLVTIVTKALGK